MDSAVGGVGESESGCLDYVVDLRIQGVRQLLLTFVLQSEAHGAPAVGKRARMNRSMFIWTLGERTIALTPGDDSGGLLRRDSASWGPRSGCPMSKGPSSDWGR